MKARYAAATVLIYWLSARRSNTLYYAAGDPVYQTGIFGAITAE